MRIYLAVTPDKLRNASRYTTQIAHAAYRIGRDGRLARQNLPPRTQGGLMLLSDEACGPVSDSRALCREIFGECNAHGFSGIVADFEKPPGPELVEFLALLRQLLFKNRMQLFLPQAYAGQKGLVLICTAISGGSFRQRMEEAAAQYGTERVALDLQRLRMRFPLPCPSGVGTPLSGGELSSLIGELHPSIFYSADLCAKYFTYSQQGKRFFVLFDDADTLLQKVRTGRELGFHSGLYMYPEVADLLPQLFPHPSNRQGKTSR